MLACLSFSAAAQAQDAPAQQGSGLAELRQKVKELSLDLLKAEAEAEELTDEEKLLKETPAGADSDRSRRLSAPEDVWDDVFSLDAHKAGEADVLLRQLEESRLNINKHKKRSEDAWSWVNEQSLDVQAKSAETEDLIGWRMGSKPSGSPISLTMIALGLLALLGGGVMLMHEIRDRLRWRLRAVGSRPSLIFLAIVVPLSAACAAWIGPDQKAPAGAPAAEARWGTAGLLADLKQKRDDLQQRLTEKQSSNSAAAEQLKTLLGEFRQSPRPHSA